MSNHVIQGEPSSSESLEGSQGGKEAKESGCDSPWSPRQELEKTAGTERCKSRKVCGEASTEFQSFSFPGGESTERPPSG